MVALAQQAEARFWEHGSVLCKLFDKWLDLSQNRMGNVHQTYCIKINSQFKIGIYWSMQSIYRSTHVVVAVDVVAIVAMIGGHRQKKAVASFRPVWPVCHTPFWDSCEWQWDTWRHGERDNLTISLDLDAPSSNCRYGLLSQIIWDFQ